MQFTKKLMNQTWENDQKPNFGLDFGPFGRTLVSHILYSWVLPLPDVRHCRKLSPYVVSRKTYDPNSGEWRKDTFWDIDLGSLGPNSSHHFCFFLVCLFVFGSFFFSKIWLRQSLSIMVSYHHVHYQKNRRFVRLNVCFYVK